jgi:integrase
VQLTARKVERARPGRHRCGLVRGLYLQVGEGNAKSWILRYQFRGRSREMGLGSAAEFTLKEARERARAARQLLADRIDPLVSKQAAEEAARLAAARKLTFADAARLYFDQNEKRWRNISHREEFLRTLREYAFPVLGRMDVASIDTPDVLRVLEPIWKSKTVTADRTRGRIAQVIDWCVVRGHRAAGTNPAKWQNHIDQVLPPPRQLAPIRHHNAMTFRDVPGFMAELRKQDTTPARALEFLILTAARSNEVLSAKWDEIDFTAKAWTVPASRMKTHREHRVPLSLAAIELLRKLPRGAGDYVFHRSSGKKAGAPHERMVFTYLMEVLGQKDKATTHGFRSSFRDFAGEMTAFPHDVCEAALAHIRGNKTVQAYARGDLFNKRRKLMDAWARHCLTPAAKVSADVLPLRSGA